VPRFLVPLSVDARNNIFASSAPTTSLIALSGKTNGDDFARLIHWDGTRNFYDRFTNYWTVGSTVDGSTVGGSTVGGSTVGGSTAGGSTAGAAAPNRSLSFEDWKHLLGDTEIESNNGGIVWKQAGTQPWQAKPSTSIRLADFELTNVNQAVSGATDNTDVGADLSPIRPISEPPIVAPPDPAQAGITTPRDAMP
jgi:hypothetical protein